MLPASEGGNLRRLRRADAAGDLRSDQKGGCVPYAPPFPLAPIAHTPRWSGYKRTLPFTPIFRTVGAMKLPRSFVAAVLLAPAFDSWSTPCLAADPNPQRYDLSKRASEIDPRAREHPEIDFVFKDDKGKVQDLQHATVDTRVPSQGKLVIWLMGHNAGLFERVASYGLHGIEVSYANRWISKLTKEQLADGESIGKIRLEAATGEDFSPLVSIPKPDGVMERSLQFVKWLARENPQGRWEQFLTPDGNGLLWEKVILSGISHGSTTAARFALHQKVDRVVMFSGPRDNTENWQGRPSATTPNRFFGFTHVLDGGWVADHYCRSWQLLKMQQFGPIVNVENAAPPFSNTRRLITDGDVKKDGRRAHTAVIPGGTAIKDTEGKYIHEAVWRYLFTHPVDQVGESTPIDPACKMDQRP